MDGIVIPEISQLSAHSLRCILEQLAGAIHSQQLLTDQRHRELLGQIAERPTLMQTTSLFSSTNKPEFVHIAALKTVEKEIREEIEAIKGRIETGEGRWKREKEADLKEIEREVGELRQKVDEVHQAHHTSRRLHYESYILSKRRSRHLTLLRGWIDLHRTFARQRAFLKRFFQNTFKQRIGRKFGDWKHTSVSVRLRNVELNISRCSTISQDSATQLASLKEDLALLKERKADQSDMISVFHKLSSIDITAAVEKTQNYVNSRFDEVNKEKRALEYRVKEAFAGVESGLSAKLTDKSLDPIRETLKGVLNTQQNLEIRLNQACFDIKSIDLNAVSMEFERKMQEIDLQIQGLVVNIDAINAEIAAKKASELLSTRALRPQVCLSCGLRSASKAPGVVGADKKLYKGEIRRKQADRRTKSELGSEMEEETRHKSNLSLAIDADLSWKRASTKRQFTPLAAYPCLLTPQHNTDKGRLRRTGDLH